MRLVRLLAPVSGQGSPKMPSRVQQSVPVFTGGWEAFSRLHCRSTLRGWLMALP
jgi:hypothetical protein